MCLQCLELYSIPTAAIAIPNRPAAAFGAMPISAPAVLDALALALHAAFDTLAALFRLRILLATSLVNAALVPVTVAIALDRLPNFEESEAWDAVSVSDAMSEERFSMALVMALTRVEMLEAITLMAVEALRMVEGSWVSCQVSNCAVVRPTRLMRRVLERRIVMMCRVLSSTREDAFYQCLKSSLKLQVWVC